MNEQFRIDELSVVNFRGFESRSFEFHPRFNVFIGDNATGKTAALEALRIAVSAWFLAIDGASPRGFHEEDVRLEGHDFEGDYTFEQRYPVVVRALGCIGGDTIEWRRTKSRPRGRTDHRHANALKRIATEADRAVREGKAVTLPMVAYYGTERLHGGVREQNPRTKAERELNRVLRQVEGLSADERESFIEHLRISVERGESSKADLSRFAGYRGSMDPRINQRELKRWMERQAWISFQERRETETYSRVRRLLASMVDGARTLDYSATRNEIVVRFGEGEQAEVQPFSQLSDGQRNVIALVGDIATRMARLNPHLGNAVFDVTPGVVLIDEIDMHLHPTWQRRVVEQLRTAFSSIQFIATSHSPFIVQSLHESELIPLDARPVPKTDNLSIKEITEGLMGVEETTDVGHRYAAAKQRAHDYLDTLEDETLTPEERLAKLEEELADPHAPYADNPAFQAVLERKRIAKLGA